MIMRWWGEAGKRWIIQAVGGPARFRVIAVLACVLALDSADKGTVGAAGPELKRSLHLSNTELGSLTAVSSAMGGLASIPVGMLTDRVRRTGLLAASIAVWSVATVAGGFAGSYTSLLPARLVLGAATATAGPTLASLIGDYFPSAERARIYGFILSGELLGAGVGLLAGGNIARLLTWRSAFWLLGLLGVALIVVIRRELPEPARGGHRRLSSGVREGEAGDARPPDPARSALRDRQVAPEPTRVLRRDPARMSIWEVTRYILAIPTNVVLIVASAMGYFFYAGLRTFSVVFVERQYHLAQGTLSGLVVIVGAGALAGTLAGGRIADRLIRRGHLDARLTVPALAFLISAGLFVPALLTTSVAIALPLFLLAAAALAASNPPVDAARLDVVPFRLWGRAESVRTVLRMAAESVAPVTFGFLADLLSAGRAFSATGLRSAFLITLVPLVASAGILLLGRRTYPHDVATAQASDER
ncbi:MFS transporter [Actinoallomurus oryzae]|uniref:MFS transporter n=1 Tax=Actinoallomurus oryzae TaxID=502180 RepID=A0ABP8Q1S5_9ACTN